MRGVYSAMIRPDYHGGSLVNLMTSLIESLGGSNGPYPPLRALPDGSLSAYRNLVLLVVDGLGDEYLQRTLPADGALARHRRGRLTSVFPSTTATAITTFLTGQAPQQHGLTGWFMYFAELEQVIAVLPFHARGRTESLAQAGVDAAQLFQHQSLFDRLAARCYVVSPKKIIESEFNLAHTGRAQRFGFVTLEEMFEAIVGCLRDGHSGRRYVYAYWPELDHIAHEHGIASPAAAAHLRELDAAFARFLPRLAGTDTAVIVTADHGFLDTTPQRTLELETLPRIAAALRLPLCGERRVAYCYVKPQWRARFADWVAEELSACATLVPSAQLIEEGWFGLGPPHPRLRERVGDCTLLMHENYAIKDWVPGEKRFHQIGLHGGASAAEMYVPLIVAAP